jgi:hypothetical protein
MNNYISVTGPLKKSDNTPIRYSAWIDIVTVLREFIFDTMSKTPETSEKFYG